MTVIRDVTQQRVIRARARLRAAKSSHSAGKFTDESLGAFELAKSFAECAAYVGGLYRGVRGKFIFSTSVTEPRAL